MTVLGERLIARFQTKHADSRQPLARFLLIARNANWPHFEAVKKTLSADRGKNTGRIIVDIAGNKYRLIASVDFKKQILLVEEILTHEQYDRKVF